MKWIGLSLVCVWIAIARAEEKNLAGQGFDLNESENQDKSSEKRWVSNSEPAPFQQTFSQDFPTLKLQPEIKNQERAKEEKTIKDFSPYDAIQSVLVNALKPKPIVDTASESEKLAPNDGSGTQFLQDLVVRGTETLSRALNTVIEVPKQAITKLSNGATQALNQLGAYIVGL